MRPAGRRCVVYSVFRPLLGLGHQLTVAGLAWLLHTTVASHVWEPIVGRIGLDPDLSGCRGARRWRRAGRRFRRRRAIRRRPAPVVSGRVSRCRAPGGPCCLQHGGFTRRAGAGSRATAFGADVVWLAAGLWLFWHWRYRDWRIALVGLLIQAQVGVHHLFEAQVNLADIDASGLPFALQVAVPGGGWFTDHLAALPSAERAGAHRRGPADARLCRCGVDRRARHRRQPTGPLVCWTVPRACPSAGQRTSHWSIGLASLCVALVTTWSPIGALAMGASNWQANAALSSVGVPRSGTASNDVETIRGVGYNPWYAGLSADQRAALYDRDFGDMHRRGVNTIEGWFENQFDSVTLDAAARNGIGVLMPFELNQDWDYSDPNMQATILARISDYVEKYRTHPRCACGRPATRICTAFCTRTWSVS